MNITVNKQGESIWLQGVEKEPLSFGGKSHDVCGGSLDRICVSETHQAYACRRCNLRIVFPIAIDVRLKLQQYLRDKFE